MRIDWDPTPRQLLVFAFALPLSVLVLGLVIGHRTDSVTVRETIWAVGGTIWALYVLVPPTRRTIYVGTAVVAFPIGWVVSHVVLFVVFWCVVTPLAVLLRILRNDPMQRRLDEAAPSYWSSRRSDPDPRRYFHQF